jgi:hypothetical protein
MSADSQRTTTLHSHRCEDLKSHRIQWISIQCSCFWEREGKVMAKVTSYLFLDHLTTLSIYQIRQRWVNLKGRESWWHNLGYPGAWLEGERKTTKISARIPLRADIGYNDWGIHLCGGRRQTKYPWSRSYLLMTSEDHDRLQWRGPVSAVMDGCRYQLRDVPVFC